MRRLTGLSFLTCILLAACGSGGGGGGDDGGGGPNPPPAVTLYVRKSGNDDETGTSPDRALKTVARAAQLLAPNTTVYVGPGFYERGIEILRVETSARAPVRLIADPEGEHTGDAPGEVVIDANGTAFGIAVTRTPFVLIDGFIVTGAGRGGNGILVRSGSTDVTIQNCVISNAGPADGVRVQSDSDDALIFNNLFFDNNRGIRIDASKNTRIINNTIADNSATGIAIGAGSPGATLRNNIIQGSGNNVSISVDSGPPSSRDGYSGDFNLAFAPRLGDQTKTYRPADIQGLDDVNEDALFVDLENGDFHLSPASPARNAGTAGIDSHLLNALLERTTSSDDRLDSPPVDMGYHYAVGAP